MAEELYAPGNSIKSRVSPEQNVNHELPNKPTKVAKAKGTKKTLKGKLLSYCFPEDVHDVRSYLATQRDYVMQNIVVPNLKRIFVEAINGMLNTNFSIKNSAPQSRNVDRYSYDYSSGSNITRKLVGTQNQKSKPVFYEDLIFDTKDDADFHRDMITEEFNRNNGSLSVLKFMELAGQETSHTQADWGWFSLNGYKCEYSSSEDGWVVSMPWPRDEVRQ